MKALLIRVGIDQAYGQWNAPVDAVSREFVYVPIPESPKTEFKEGMRSDYSAFLAAVEMFSDRFGGGGRPPADLASRASHLDPDFAHLSYGDNGERRGSRVTELLEGDLIVFYSGLRAVQRASGLVYAIVGLFVIDRVLRARDLPAAEHFKNAHTRKTNPCGTDVIAFGKPDSSGRLRRCLPIGEFRDRAYRVRTDLLDAWGGLSVNDGYIQRSAVPPWFLSAERFYDWFMGQGPELEACNVPC
jgi:hypothetical protein